MRIFVIFVAALLAVLAGAFVAGYDWLTPEIAVIEWNASTTPCSDDSNNTDDSDNQEWQTASAVEAGFNAETLSTLTERINKGDIENIHSVLVVREGAIAYEEYFTGEDWALATPLGEIQFTQETLHDLRSVTKSVVSILLGIAMKEGHITDLDTPILEFLSDYKQPLGFDLSARIEKITLRHALTMTAGQKWDELSHPYWHPRNDETAMWRELDPVAYALTRPVQTPPGERFTYNGGLPTVIAAILEKTTQTQLETYARDKLFCPIGISAYEWVEHTPSGLPMAASGLRLTPRAMARIGQLMMNGGTWGDNEILSSDFVSIATSPLAVTNVSIAPSYGYQWWVVPMETQYGDIEIPMAIGNGGQRIVLIRPVNMVIVITAGSYNLPNQGEASRKVIEAILDAIDAES